MADISLQDYLDKLDTLLKENGYNEVVYHARHIIQQFPKNLAAYRLLGQSLMLETRWEEAGEVLRRVLSVQPDDLQVHRWLAQVYQRMKQPERVIWHLERVFDHEPNNTALIDNLRELYRTHRNREPGKLRLTTSAVARQFVQNHQYEQAISLLRETLARSPQRVDLRLLLAKILRQAGRHVDAAEVAFEVLRQLPDCLDANLILAEVWLAEGRPSDAQRYINRIEAIVPYLALRLARGEEPDPDEITLEELDYQAVARRDLTAENPDWLAVVDDMPLDIEQMSTDEEPAESESLELPVQADDEDDFDLSAAWLDADEDIDTMQGQAHPAAEQDPTDFDFGDLFSEDDTPEEVDGDVPPVVFSEFDEPETESDKDDTLNLPSDWMENDPAFDDLLEARVEDDDSEPPALPDRPRRTGRTSGLLSALDSDEPDDTPEEESPGTFEETALPDFDAISAEDALDWLQDDGDDMADDDSAMVLPDGLLDDDASITEDESVDPLSWLEDDPDVAEAPEGDMEDPLAWLHKDEIDVLDDSQAGAIYDPYAEEDDELQDPAEVDPLAWLRESGAEIIDGESEEVAPVGDDVMMHGDDPLDAGDEEEPDPLAWLRESGAEIIDGESEEVAPVDASPVEPEPPPTPAAEPDPETLETLDTGDDWMSDSDQLDEMLDMEALASGDDIFATSGDEESVDDGELPPIVAADAPDEVQTEDSSVFDVTDQDDVMPVQNDDEFPDWFDSEPSSEDPDLEWLSGGDGDGEDEETGSGPVAVPDDAEPALFGDTGGGFDWNDEVDDESGEEESETPDWLQSGSLFDDEDEDSAEVAAAWLASSGDGESPDDSLDEDDDESHEEEADNTVGSFAWEPDASIDDTPDWLNEIGDDSEAEASDSEESDESDAAAAAAASGFLAAGAALAFDAVTDEPAGDDADSTSFEDDQPDWLSDLGDDAEVADDQPAWLAGLGGDDDTEPAESDDDAAPVTGDQPDWLVDSAMDEPDEEPLPAADREPEWLSGLDDEEDDEDDADYDDELEPDEFEEPEWLSSLDDEDEEDEADYDDELEPDEFEEPEWLSSLDDDEEDEDDDLVTDDEPEWLSDTVMDEEFTDSAGDDEEKDEEVPDWLSGIGLDADEDEEAEPAAGEINDFDLVAGGFGAEEPVFDEDAEPADGDEVPDWLSGIGADDEDDEEEPAPAEEVPDWLGDFDDEDEEADEFDVYAAGEESEPTVEEGVPDWLAAAAPAAMGAEESDDVAEESDDEFASIFDGDDEDDDEIGGDGFDWADIGANAGEYDAAVDDGVTAGDFEAFGEYDEDEDAVPDWLGEASADAGFEEPEAVSGSPEEPVVPGWPTDGIEEPAELYAESPVSDDTLEADAHSVEDEIETVPATNAPDWLNTMVPGLDIDYEAGEDAPLEASYVEEPLADSQRMDDISEMETLPIPAGAEFDWLTRIVDDELRPPGPLPESTGPRRRFVFSQLPLWLRDNEQAGAQDDATATETDDIFDDELGEDLPPWLEFDDDEK